MGPFYKLIQYWPFIKNRGSDVYTHFTVAFNIPDVKMSGEIMFVSKKENVYISCGNYISLSTVVRPKHATRWVKTTS